MSGETAGTARGRLLLVPAPLDFGCETQTPLQETLPAGTLVAAARTTHWICENAKSARAYLKRIDALHPLALPLQEQQITELPRAVHKKGDHGGPGHASADTRALLAPALAGAAGCARQRPRDDAGSGLARPDPTGSLPGRTCRGRPGRAVSRPAVPLTRLTARTGSAGNYRVGAPDN